MKHKIIIRKIGSFIVVAMFAMLMLVQPATADGDTELNVAGGYIFDIDFNADDDDKYFIVKHEDGAEIFRAQEDGKFGIGDTDPDFKLEVVGSSGDGYFGVSSAADNDGDIFIIDSSGNVGIGTASPQAKLDVRPGSTDTGILVRQPGVPYSGNFLQVEDSTSQYRWRVDNTYAMYLTTDLGTDVVKIGDVGDIYFNNGGDVGIGTTTPGARLDVELTSGGAATIGASSNSATGAFSIAVGQLAEASGDFSAAIGLYTTASGLSSFALGSSATASGDYSHATGKLTTAAGDYSNAMGYRTQANGDYSTAMGNYMWVTGQNSIGISLSSTLHQLGQSNTMAIMGGKVGIGTANPDRTLEIQDDNNPQLRLSQWGGKYADFNVDTNHNLLIKTSSDGQIKLQPTFDSTDFFQVLDADGGTPILNVDAFFERVGIGTTSPSTTLEVNGDVAFGGGSDLTISSGVVTATHSFHKIIVESGTSDNLDTISGGDVTGQILIIRAADSTKTVTVRDESTSSGNIILLEGNNFDLDHVDDTLTLIYDGSNWLELSQSNNSP